jgi:catechol 2,3-dioxygenase-like lactoylglutathione lyase family enzyme
VIRILHYDHIVLRVRDLPRMIAFYRDALGCTLEKTQEELGLVHLRAGSALIDLIDIEGKLGREGGGAPGGERRNVDHFCLRVEPFEPAAIAAHLERCGAAPEPPARRYGADGYGPSIYLRDPEGNRIELKGPPEEPPLFEA